MLEVDNFKIKTDLVRFENIKQDPVELIPYELILEIFSNLTLNELASSCLVCSKWKHLASESKLWQKAICKELATSTDGDSAKQEFLSLPLNSIVADYRAFKRVFPEKKLKKNVFLVRFSKSQNLKNLEILAKQFFGKGKGFRFVCTDAVNELGDRSIDKSFWGIMTAELPESRGKKLAEQMQQIANLANRGLIEYRAASALESMNCILAQDFNGRKCEEIKTRCQEPGMVVGGFSTFGAFIEKCSEDQIDSSSIGIVAFKCFSSP